MAAVAVVLVLCIAIAPFRRRSREAQHFCHSFGIPISWADPKLVEGHVIRARTIRLVALLIGLAAGWAAAPLIPTSNQASATICSGADGAPVQIRELWPAQRSVNDLRSVRTIPGFARGTPTGDSTGRITCPSGVKFLGPVITTNSHARHEPRKIPGAALGGLVAYIVAIWMTERRARWLAAPNADEEREPMPSSSKRQRTIRTASLDRRRLRDYLPTWLVWIGAAYGSWIAAALFASIRTSDLADPLLWPSWRFEPAATVGIICILTITATIVCRGIVLAPKPFGPVDTAAAIIDDARRLGSVQRLAAATMVLGALAATPSANLIFSKNGSPVGTFGLMVLAVFWFALPWTTDTLHQRWVTMASHHGVATA